MVDDPYSLRLWPQRHQRKYGRRARIADLGCGVHRIVSHVIALLPTLVSRKHLEKHYSASRLEVGVSQDRISCNNLGFCFDKRQFQYRVGKANAPRIIAACDQFHAATGRFPKTLDELVPRYLPAVPCASIAWIMVNFDILIMGTRCSYGTLFRPMAERYTTSRSGDGTTLISCYNTQIANGVPVYVNKIAPMPLPPTQNAFINTLYA